MRNTRTPRIQNYTIRKTDFGTRVLITDELGYDWECNFMVCPTEQEIMASWKEFKTWRRTYKGAL